VSGSIKGTVIEVDQQGSLVTDIASYRLAGAPRDASIKIMVDEHETFGLFEANHDQPDMTLIAILGAAEAPLKIELVSDSASAMLGVRAGAPVEIVW